MTDSRAALEEAAAVLLPGYLELVALPGERDLNARVRRADGRLVVLKVAATDTDPARLDLEDAVLGHLAAHTLPVKTPSLIERRTISVAGQSRTARVLTWIDGDAVDRPRHGRPRPVGRGHRRRSARCRAG